MAARASAVTLYTARYEGLLAILVGLGGIAHVAANLDRMTGLWGLGLGALGLLTLGSLLVMRKIVVAEDAVEFNRLVDKHPKLRVPFSAIRGAGYNEKLRAFEVKTASGTYHARMGRDVAKRLAKALKEAGLKAR